MKFADEWIPEGGIARVSGDLHCHTCLSDGSMGIEEIILLAKRSGLSAIAITDHDCLAGTVRGVVLGERHGVRVIPGVEISCLDYERGYRKVHLLAYLSDHPDRLEGICHRNVTMRRKAGLIMAAKASERYPISTELVQKHAATSTNIFKQHIMHALMECGYTKTIYGDLFNELFSSKSPDNISVKLKFPDCREVLKKIHEAGGIAVLAHPANYNSFDLLDELIPLGLDGVEVYHPSADVDTSAYLYRKAKAHGLLVTGGSDFHGMYNFNKVNLGSYTATDEAIEELLNYKSKRRRAAGRRDESNA